MNQPLPNYRATTTRNATLDVARAVAMIGVVTLDGLSQVGSGQVGIGQAGPCQVGLSQVGPWLNGPAFYFLESDFWRNGYED